MPSLQVGTRPRTPIFLLIVRRCDGERRGCVHDPMVLMAPVVDLLDSADMRTRLGKKLAELTPSNASERLAVLLLEVAKR